MSQRRPVREAMATAAAKKREIKKAKATAIENEQENENALHLGEDRQVKDKANDHWYHCGYVLRLLR